MLSTGDSNFITKSILFDCNSYIFEFVCFFKCVLSSLISGTFKIL